MAAYLIVEHKITDARKFEKYRSKVGPMIAKHGDGYLTTGGTHKVVSDNSLAAGSGSDHRTEQSTARTGSKQPVGGPKPPQDVQKAPSRGFHGFKYRASYGLPVGGTPKL
jgi:hypothetical protein